METRAPRSISQVHPSHGAPEPGVCPDRRFSAAIFQGFHSDRGSAPSPAGFPLLTPGSPASPFAPAKVALPRTVFWGGASGRCERFVLGRDRGRAGKPKLPKVPDSSSASDLTLTNFVYTVNIMRTLTNRNLDNLLGLSLLRGGS